MFFSIKILSDGCLLLYFLSKLWLWSCPPFTGSHIFDLGLVNTVKLGGKVVAGTWRCLKAAVSWVMCRVRHLDVHLALLIFS